MGSELFLIRNVRVQARILARVSPLQSPNWAILSLIGLGARAPPRKLACRKVCTCRGNEGNQDIDRYCERWVTLLWLLAVERDADRGIAPTSILDRKSVALTPSVVAKVR